MPNCVQLTDVLALAEVVEDPAVDEELVGPADEAHVVGVDAGVEHLPVPARRHGHRDDLRRRGPRRGLHRLQEAERAGEVLPPDGVLELPPLLRGARLVLELAPLLDGARPEAGPPARGEARGADEPLGRGEGAGGGGGGGEGQAGRGRWRRHWWSRGGELGGWVLDVASSSSSGEEEDAAVQVGRILLCFFFSLNVLGPASWITVKQRAGVAD